MKEEKEFIIRLLHKPEFKQWVLSPTEESDYYWKRWIEKHPAEHTSVLKAREIILRMRFHQKSPSNAEIDGLLNNIVAAPKKTPRPQFSLPYRLLKYAAILALAIVSGTVLVNVIDQPAPYAEQEEVIVKDNPKGQRSIVQLPDGTKVHLNTNSTLTYRESYNEQRTVELSGEAFFQVVENPGNPFTVLSADVSTTALGTSFNIRSVNGSTEVLLVTGKVQVKKLQEKGKQNSQKTYILTESQKISYHAQSGFSDITRSENLNEILWKDGVLHFDNTPLEQVSRTLEDWYGVDITIEGPYRNIRYSGQFRNEYLTTILNSMKFSLNLEYVIDKNNVKLKTNSR